jgi:hypothetical protein
MIKTVSIHAELKKLCDTYFQNGGSSSVSKSFFNEPKNTYFDNVHKLIIDRGYKKVYSNYGDTEYHKDLNAGKNTAKVTVTHNATHVYSVSTITYLNHY